MTKRHWGENSSGNWTLIVSDTRSGGISDWGLNLYGKDLFDYTEITSSTSIESSGTISLSVSDSGILNDPNFMVHFISIISVIGIAGLPTVIVIFIYILKCSKRNRIESF